MQLYATGKDCVKLSFTKPIVKLLTAVVKVFTDLHGRTKKNVMCNKEFLSIFVFYLTGRLMSH